MAYETGTVWRFKAGRYLVVLNIARDYGYQYDGDDEDGETQAQLDSGEYVAFDSTVQVIDPNGVVIGEDHLGGSVYAYDDMSDFWTAHRDADPRNRNCTIMRGQHPAGPNVSIGHYFPDMVSQAVREARNYLREVQTRHIRAA